jgi:hypothetical protein
MKIVGVLLTFLICANADVWRSADGRELEAEGLNWLEGGVLLKRADNKEIVGIRYEELVYEDILKALSELDYYVNDKVSADSKTVSTKSVKLDRQTGRYHLFAHLHTYDGYHYSGTGKLTPITRKVRLSGRIVEVNLSSPLRGDGIAGVEFYALSGSGSAKPSIYHAQSAVVAFLKNGSPTYFSAPVKENFKGWVVLVRSPNTGEIIEINSSLRHLEKYVIQDVPEVAKFKVDTSQIKKEVLEREKARHKLRAGKLSETAGEGITLIEKNADWSYLSGSDPKEGLQNWYVPNFSTKGWEEGKAGFGYGNDDEETTLNMKGKFGRLYLRKSFTVPSDADMKKVILKIAYDDGFIAYINGQEIWRQGVGRNRGKDAEDILWREESEELDFVSFPLRDLTGILKVGSNNILAIEGHNVGLSSSDFSLHPTLSIGRKPQGNLAKKLEKKVAALISESVDKADKQSPRDKVFKLDGKWRFKFERGKYVMREFKGKYLIDENGGRHKVTKLGEFVQIDWGGRAFERVSLDPEKPDLLEGINYQGNKFKYERVK